MVNITAYSEGAIRHLRNRLVLKQKNGILFEYEIRVDNEPVTPRSSDLERFFSFQEFIFASSESLEIWVYIGSSKRYDKYIFELKQKPVTPQADFEVLLAEALRKQKMEFDLQELNKELKDSKEKNKDLKEDNKELKQRIRQLEEDAKNTNIVSGLIGALKHTNLLDKSGASPNPLNGTGTASENETTILNGFADSEVLNVLKTIQQNLGDELFQNFLGTALTLGQNPTLIPVVRELIETSLKKSAS